MALRVLLADESSTIKKVFQLALQDYAVEVRPVNIGVDVAAVAKGFKPDIIFADVMLQKKNGYDVCSELKQDNSLRGIPFVLMWSGFMELDEDKFQASQANAQLEKPFDVAALRKLVSELVPRTQSQSLSQYLTFPKGQVEADPQPEIKESPGDKYRLKMKPEELDPSHIVDDIFKTPEKDQDEEFTVRPPSHKATAAMASVEKPPEFTPPPLPPELDLEDMDMEMEPDEPPPHRPSVPPAVPKALPVTAKPEGLSTEQLEKIIREQSAEVIESVVWKVIPELAAQIIERELNKLLKERDSHPY